MVVFLFVIMLLDLGHPSASDMRGPLGLMVGTLLAAGLGLKLAPLVRAAPPLSLTLPPGTLEAATQTQGLVGVVARPLFGTYLLPFEIASILLLAAIVGAVVLAKREL